MKNRFSSRFKSILVYTILLLIVLITIGILLAPTLARNYINKNGKELAGRTVNIEKLKYNFFTSTLQIHGFKYFEKNDVDVFASFDTFMVNMKPLKLLKNEIYVQELQLVNSNANIVQNRTVFNFDDLITFFSPADSTNSDAETEDSRPLKLNLHNLELKNGSAHYTDLEIDHTLKLEEVSFMIPEILWNKLDSSKADVEFKLADGGDFASSFNYNADLGEYSGFVQIDKLETKAFLPYAQQFIDFSNLGGTLSGRVNFKGLVSDVTLFTVDGIVEIDSVAAYNENGKKVIGGDRYRVVLQPSFPVKNEIFIDSVLLDKPYIYLALEDSLFNFEKMLVVSNDSISEESQNLNEEDISGNIVLNHFKIIDGLMDFSDQTLREEFNYELSEIKVEMDTISLNDNWVNVNANMKLNKRGKLEANVGLNPFDPFNRIDLDYVLTDFQLPDINIYSKHYVGLPILFGDMYYVNKTTIINKQLESENELIIRNVEMGRKTGGLYDVPIKLALFILKDVNGDIVLDVPVRGDLSDPKVKIGSIVWDTFKGFMFKIVASPFKALGNLINADPKDLEEITFDYGDTTLTNQQIKSLDLLLDLEQKKPEIQIELCYLNDKKLEKFDAASQISQELYFQKNGRKTNPGSNDYLKFLKDETGKDSLLVQDYEVLVAPRTDVENTIEQRQEQRISLIKQYLETKSDSIGIVVKGYDEKDVLNIGSRPRFEVRIALAEDAEE
jgi:hypothetical protein